MTPTDDAPWGASRMLLVALSLTACGAAPAAAPGAPTIDAFSPVAGPVGATVRISGSNFGPGARARFGGVEAQVTSASSAALSAVVPFGAASGPISVSVAGLTASSAASFTVEATPAAVAPEITTQPASLSVLAGQGATFSVVATGTPPLAYAWSLNQVSLGGASGPSYAIASAAAGQAGDYQVTVSNAAGSVASRVATLTVLAQSPVADFELTGFAAGTTGGGQLDPTDPAYRQCTTPLELASAIRDANAGNVKVIEVMNDLDLGWLEVGPAVQGLTGTPFRAHAAARTHPKLIASGVSLIDLKPAAGGVTLFSANGAALRHATLNVKSTSNIIIRNLEFDELWEWDEDTRGQYDTNDWDFIDLGNGGPVHGVWIDHCTFTKAYDGVVDIKGGSAGITLSWNRYVGDDGASNPHSFVRQQLEALEQNRASYPMYDFFRANGFSLEDLVALHQGHDKTHLFGSNALDPANATLTVTLHHQWYQNTWDRLPRLRGGQVHTYNLWADASGALAAQRRRNALVALMSTANQATANNTYSLKPPLNGSISTEGGAVLVEKSIYLDLLWPLRNNQTAPSNPLYTGKILATDTLYQLHERDGGLTEVRGDSTAPGNPLGPLQAPVIAFSWNAFSTLPYLTTPDDPALLPALLRASAGAGAVTWDKRRWLQTGP